MATLKCIDNLLRIQNVCPIPDTRSDRKRKTVQWIGLGIVEWATWNGQRGIGNVELATWNGQREFRKLEMESCLVTILE